MSDIEFSVFCIENIAKKFNVDAPDVYKAITERSNILREYIIPNYEVLHTQSKDYIVDDIIAEMHRRGVNL